MDDSELYEVFELLMVNADSLEEFAEKKVKESDKYADMGEVELKNLQSQIEMEADDRLDDYFDEFKGESDSLAGLVLEVEGRILKIGETCRIAPYTFLVESADVRRIKRLKVTIDER